MTAGRGTQAPKVGFGHGERPTADASKQQVHIPTVLAVYETADVG